MRRIRQLRKMLSGQHVDFQSFFKMQGVLSQCQHSQPLAIWDSTLLLCHAAMMYGVKYDLNASRPFDHQFPDSNTGQICCDGFTSGRRLVGALSLTA